jgi:predicted Fe-Mo cluster-binding NifX family protein
VRIAVSADDNRGLDSVVSPNFGRCPYYVLVDVEGTAVEEVSAVANPYFDHHQRGKVPGFIHGHGADVMLTGGMGRRALGLFEQYGVEAVTGVYGSVRRAVEGYLGGELRGADACGKSTDRGHEHEPLAGDYEQGEVARLREEAEMLQRQLTEVLDRLDGLTAN